MAQISIKVNGAAQSVESDQRPTHLFADDSNIVVCKVNGELKDFIREDKTKYRDINYYNDDLDYWDYPWEIEAHGREPGLYYRFIKKLREDKKKKTNKI